MSTGVTAGAAAVLYAAAGSYLFIELASRRLVFIRQARLQKAALLAAFAALVPGGALLGWRLGFSVAALAPAAVLAAGAAYEGWVAALRRRTRGSAPTRRHRPARRRVITTTELDVLHYALRLPGWRGRPCRIAHLSDLHVGPGLPPAYYRRVWAAVQSESPDLVFITGDFVTHRGDLAQLPAALTPPAAALGAFAVLGNHDQWSGGAEVAECVRRAGIDVIHNGWRTVETGDGQRLLIAGCEDPWGPEPWRPWTAGDAAGRPVLVLAHTADTIHRLAEAGAAAVFAGHYHGGQFRLPLLGAAVLPSRFGRRFVHGHFRVRDTHLFVSAGVGASGPPLRIACPPDVLIIDVGG